MVLTLFKIFVFIEMETGLQELWSVAEFVAYSCHIYMDKSHHKALPWSQGLVGPSKKSV